MKYSIEELKQFYSIHKFPCGFDEIQVCEDLGYFLPDNLPRPKFNLKGSKTAKDPAFITQAISSLVAKSKGETDFLLVFEEYKAVFREALDDGKAEGVKSFRLVNHARVKANQWLLRRNNK